MTPADGISWEHRMPLLTNRFMLKDFALLTIITMLVMQTFFLAMCAIVGADLLFLPPIAWAVIAGAFFVLFIFATLIVMGNRYNVRYRVNAEGVAYDSGTREKRVNRVLFWMSLLSGKPGATGSSMLAMSNESNSYKWSDIYRVIVHPSPRVITIRNSWRTVARLYCTEENFTTVAELAQTYAAKAAAEREERNIHPPRYGFCARWAGLTAIAFIAAVAWLFGHDVGRTKFWSFYWKADGLAPVSLGVSAVVFLAGVFVGWTRRIIAVVATAGSIFLLIGIYVMATNPYTSDEGSFFGYEVDPHLMVVSAVGGVALLAMSVSLIFISGRPRDDRSTPPKASQSSD